MKRRTLVLGMAIVLLTASPVISPVIKERVHREQIKDEPVRTKATMEEKRANKKLAKRYAWIGYGWRGKQWACIDYIFTKEARYDHLADNKKSSAFGIGQVLGETSKDPTVQILRAYRYITHRYGTPCRAKYYHLRYNHY